MPQVSRSFRPALEPLEDRNLLATGLSATLAAGVLTIDGTSGPDQINVRQINGRISIDNTPIKVGANTQPTVAASVVNRLVVNGLAGNDTILLNSEATPGQQALAMTAVVNGGDGDDLIRSGAGWDTIYGGAGNDTVYGNAGNDTIYGDAGDDTLYGEAGDDKLYGGDGNDTLYGGDGNDALDGGAGSNRLDGGPGANTLANGAGVAAAMNADLTSGVLTINGTNNPDLINVRNVNGRVSIDGLAIKVGANMQATVAAGVVNRIVVNGLGGNDTIQLNSEATPGQQPLTMNTTLNGGDGDDVIYGGAGRDTISGGAGNDKLYGGDGDDYLDGGSGSDVTSGGAGFNSYHENMNLAQPFSNGAAAGDILQQNAPTCATLATLAALAMRGYNFASQVTNVGNGQYDVRLWNDKGVPTTQRVAFDGTWNDNDPAPARDASGRNFSEFWTILFQRARLQMYGVNYHAPLSVAQWNAANDASQGFLLDAGEAIYNFTGAYPAYYKANQVDPQTIASAAQAGKVIVLTTPGSGATTTLDPGTGIVAWHAYALVDMKSVNGQWLVTLYNPWGRDGNAAPKDGVDDGRLTVPWTTVATYFNSIRVA